MKKINNIFEWYDQEFWYWPEYDEKLIQVNDWVFDADMAIKHCDGLNVCLQAGGACGVWPAYLSKKFNKVITFEGDRVNYQALELNTRGILNIESHLQILSADNKKYSTKLDDFEKNNCGAIYVEESEYGRESISLDYFYSDTNPGKVDLICLDVEGFESNIISGAMELIDENNPVIMVEEKPLAHMPNLKHLDGRKLLESIGYKQVDRAHRDVVFKRC